METSWHCHIIITTVPVVHHSLLEEHHIGPVVVLEVVVLVGRGADDFPLVHLVRLALHYCHIVHRTYPHNVQAEGLEALHSRQDHLDRSWEEGGIVETVEEDALSHNLVVVGFRHIDLKVCRHMAVG